MASDSVIRGLYQAANSSASCPALVTILNGNILLNHSDEQGEILFAPAGDYQFGDAVPGLPVELIFADGSRFIPDDIHLRWQQLGHKPGIIEWLERHWSAVLAAMLLVPAFMWLMITQVIPAGSNAVAGLLPDVVARQLGSQSLAIIDRTYMNPSELSDTEQQVISQRWQHLLTTLNIPAENYRLEFRSWSGGPNAMALPDGTVIVTDAIARLMAAQPEQLDAVLLHEIGHVEHKHSLKILSQTTAMSLMFTMMFGDVEGIGELLLGAGTSFAQASFSRDMESDADQFAFRELQTIGRTPQDFADAMKTLAQHYRPDAELAEPEDDEKSLFDYLRSHPATTERIAAAEALAKEMLQ